MPIKVPSSLPAISQLEQESVFVMADDRAVTQEIRPLKIAVLNLMPNKISTETQLIRLLANNPLQIELVLLKTASYDPKTESKEHLQMFYLTFNEVLERGLKFDGLIITGAPVEKMDFVDVAYWEELRRIMKWAEHHVYSSMYICWAAQAAMFYRYGINKTVLDDKIFGIFKHRVFHRNNPLVRGFDESFDAPHSRFTQVEIDKVYAEQDLEVLAESDEAGIYLASSKSLREVYVFGHGEYDRETLHNEYVRDCKKGLDAAPPKNYYTKGLPDIDSAEIEWDLLPPMTWRAHESLLIANWLNYCVYQATPFNIESID